MTTYLRLRRSLFANESRFAATSIPAYERTKRKGYLMTKRALLSPTIEDGTGGRASKGYTPNGHLSLDDDEIPSGFLGPLPSRYILEKAITALFIGKRRFKSLSLKQLILS